MRHCAHLGKLHAEARRPELPIVHVMHCAKRQVCTIDDHGLKSRTGEPLAVCNTCELYTPTDAPTLTIGSATFDDYPGVWATYQALHNARVEAGLLDEIEFVIVDNHPTGKHAEATRGQVANWPKARYIEFTDHQGTSGPRNAIFQHATGRGVLVIDPHVLLVRPVATLRKLVEFWSGFVATNTAGVRGPSDRDLFHGPCLYDGLVDQQGKPAIIGTHWKPEWGTDGMFGKWSTAEPFALNPHAINDPEAQPFEIPLAACGLFLAARESWLGFHAEQRGFGAEEGTIHHKYRKHGRTSWCLPWLQWVHRWGRVGGVPYQGMEWLRRAENYLLSTRDYAWPSIAELREVFVTHRAAEFGRSPNQRCSAEDFEAILDRLGLGLVPSPPSAGERARVRVRGSAPAVLHPDPGLQSWETEYLSNPVFDCAHREHRAGAVMCNIGCASMQSQPVSLFHCAAHNDLVTLVSRRRERNHCFDCSLRKPHDQTDSLIAHVSRSIQQADRLISRLPESTLAVQGMTSPRVRHLMNNLCAWPEARYLEIGVWLGALFISANAGNKLTRAVAVDDFSEFNQYGTAQESFLHNCAKHLGLVPSSPSSGERARVRGPALISSQFQQIAQADLTEQGPFDVYLYDGAHDPESHRAAITHVWPALAERCVIVIDDANEPDVIETTHAALESVDATIDREWLLPARRNGDVDQWWNGIYIAVVKR